MQYCLCWGCANVDVSVVPWGRFMDIRSDLADATKSEAEGGTGIGKRFWEWTEEQIKPYL